MTSAFTDISPALAATHSPDVLRDEVLRRMEVYVLETLHQLTHAPPCSPTGSSHGGQGEGERPAAVSHAKSAVGAADPHAVLAPHAVVEEASWRETAKPHEHRASTPPTSSARSSVHVPVPRRAADHASPSLAAGPLHACSAALRTLHTVRHHLLVLAVLFGNVRSSVVATQRDVYYHLVRHVPAQAVVNRTVLQLARALRVPRQLMGVVAGVRGFVAGCVSYRGESLMPRAGGSGWGCAGPCEGGHAAWGGDEGRGFAEGMPLPLLDDDLVVHLCLPASGATTCDAAAAPRAPPVGFQVSPNVCAILVVEKHAVFAQLLREGLPRVLPCVLLTSQGFPTHAARRLVAALHAALPRAALVGLADHNPHGLAILVAYRWASPTAAPPSPLPAPDSATPPCAAYEEVRHYALPALRWLGVRGEHIARLHGRNNVAGPSSVVPPPAPSAATAEAVRPPLQPFTPRDAVVLRNLTERLEAMLAAAQTSSTAASRAEQASVRAWLAEAKEMARRRVKCELEVLYTPPHARWFVPAVADAGVGAGREQGDHALMPRQFAEWVKEQLLRRAYC